MEGTRWRGVGRFCRESHLIECAPCQVRELTASGDGAQRTSVGSTEITKTRMASCSRQLRVGSYRGFCELFAYGRFPAYLLERTITRHKGFKHVRNDD
jgi:hypothetical protein